MQAAGADFVIDIIIALLGGILIGLERERAQLRPDKEPSKTATMPGMRSFGLLSMYGATVAYFAKYLASGLSGGSTILPIAFSSFALIVVVHAYARMVKQRVLGITTYLVMLITFLVGFLAGLGLHLESASLSVLVTLVLALKYPAERMAASISYSEMLALLEVAAISLVVGPIVKSYAEAQNIEILYKVYIFFTIILTISFISYVAARVWGSKGLLYAAALGSLVNSEATISSVTSIISKLRDKALRSKLLSTTTRIILSILQVKSAALVIVAFYLFAENIPVEAILAAGILTLADVIVALVGVEYDIGDVEGVRIEVKSPLSWSVALRSAIAYFLLILVFDALSKLSGTLPLDLTTVIVAALGGLANATATILSLATVYSSINIRIILLSMFISIATASLNKILYADTSELARDEVNVIIKWSLILSLFPLLVGILVYMI